MSETSSPAPDAVAPAVTREPRTAEFSRNRWTYGIGTVGRDMVYALVSLFLVYYLTDIVNVPSSTMWWVTGLLLSIRIIDALLDPIMGAVVDSTRSRWGQFKPWLVVGGLSSAAFTVLLFTNTGMTGTSFVVVFAVFNLLWGISWTAHDIPYWSLLPALSLNQKEREDLGAVAKVFASVGQFAVVAGIVPLTDALTAATGSAASGFQLAAVIIVLVMILGMTVTVLFVREPQDVVLTGAHTGARELSRALFRNDQLLWAASAYLLFMVGYGTTGAFGLYFFKYVYGDENVFPLFALFVGVGQLAGFALFPWFSARWRRGRLYTGATLVVVASYVLFIVAPMNLVFLGVAAFSLFFAASFIQLLMIVFQADTIEYGQVKLGQRNNAVTFALQPFINKTSGAMNTAIVGAAVILSGINDASGPQDMTAGGIAVVKVAMMVIPGLCIVAGYLIWRAKFVIDEEMHARLVAELDARGALAED
jgi:melibiose permease/lactose/raffinose/galactose permease